MNITVVGTGYVGLSIACLLAQNNHVHALDVVQEKVDLICADKSPIQDKEIEEFLESGKLNLTASCNANTKDAKCTKNTKCSTDIEQNTAYTNTDYIVIATPTNYDSEKNFFDTSSIESVLDEIVEQIGAQSETSSANEPTQQPCIVIKSTIPVGYTEKISQRYSSLNIVFSPEFLREGHALYDNLHPSRIVIGVPFHNEALMQPAKTFAQLLASAAQEQSDSIPILIVGSTEAEAIKLFSNTYLALRIAYFNELDTYAEQQNLNSKEIIEGMGLDARIGTHYNNPSFGYGGYCLPKDSKQLLANFADIPQCMMGAVIKANRTRKDYIAQRAVELAQENHKAAGKSPNENDNEDDSARPLIGIYRLTMKKNSDNFRHSSTLGVMRRLENEDVTLLVYEPTYNEPEIYGNEVTHDLPSFKKRCDVILANRANAELDDVASKVYTRDLFKRD